MLKLCKDHDVGEINQKNDLSSTEYDPRLQAAAFIFVAWMEPESKRSP